MSAACENRQKSIFLAALTRVTQTGHVLDDLCRRTPRCDAGEALLSRQRAGQLPGQPIDRGCLRSIRRARPTLDQPITERPGTVIGPYKLLQQIGEGGHGRRLHGRADRAGPAAGGAEDHQAGHGHPAGDRPIRGRAAGPGADGPSQHRPRARRRARPSPAGRTS